MNFLFRRRSNYIVNDFGCMSFRYLPISSESDSDQPAQEGRVVSANSKRRSMTDSNLSYARFQNENGDGVPSSHMIEPFQMSDVRMEGGSAPQVSIVTSSMDRGQHYPRDSSSYYDGPNTSAGPSTLKPSSDDPSRRQSFYRGSSVLPRESVFGDPRDDTHLVPESAHRAGKPWNFTIVLNAILQAIDPCEALHRYEHIKLCICISD